MLVPPVKKPDCMEYTVDAMAEESAGPFLILNAGAQHKAPQTVN
jgi:hypothetical protein